MTESNYNYKRRFERFQTEGLACDICGFDGGRLRDISIGGAGILVREPVVVGSTCVLGINAGEQRYKIVARVIWSRANGVSRGGDDSLAYSIGLSFDKTSIEASKDLVFSVMNRP